MYFPKPKITSLEDHIAALSKERRASLRSDCWHEVITQINGLPSDTVVISNVSESGALMLVAPGTEIPEEFQLLGLNEKAMDCRRVWDDGNKVGIAFKDKLDPSSVGKYSAIEKVKPPPKNDIF